MTSPALPPATLHPGAAQATAPPRPLAPLGGGVVDPAIVTFRWEGVPGARGYRIEIGPDRQFARGVVALDAGPSTELTLTDAVPTTDAPLFWRVRAEIGDGLTRWSPYGRFYVGSDAAVDAFRAQQDAARAEARKERLRRRTEAEAARDLVPYYERDDMTPPDAGIATIGIGMLGGFLVLLLILYFVA